MNVFINTSEVNIKSWSDFVSLHPNGNFFQTPEIHEFYSKVKNFEPIFICAVQNNEIQGLLVAVIQKETGYKGKFSTRSIIYGGPLVKNNSDNITEIILQAYNAIANKRVIYTQIRNIYCHKELIESYAKCGFKYTKHLNYIIPISTADELKKRISESKLRQIKKGLKIGTSIIEATQEEQVKVLYGLLKNLYKNKIKQPLPDYSFFINFFNLICKKKEVLFF